MTTPKKLSAEQIREHEYVNHWRSPEEGSDNIRELLEHIAWQGLEIAELKRRLAPIDKLDS